MTNDSKKYVSFARLSTFLDNIRLLYSQIGHKHTISDMTDYKVDAELSSTSTNPIQNKVVDAEFEEIAVSMRAMSLALDGKSDANHNHDDKYYTETEIDTKLASKSDTTHKHDALYDAKGASEAALASAKTYADSAATKVKNDLLNGAGGAYDTLKELGDLIDDNADAIDALEIVATGKADKVHTHEVSDVNGLQTALDGKAASSHGTHVSYSSTAPVMDGTASVGSASTVARSDHKHPTDTSRAAKTDLDSHTSNTTVHITSAERTNWNAAKTTAESAQTRADSAYTLAESKVDSLSDLGITATATELNYVDGVKSNVQTQLDELRNDIDSIPQEDWNQNDSTQLDFIKNRPFYTTDPIDTVIAEGTIPANGTLKTSAIIDSLTLGETYTVIFDGVTYSNIVCEDYEGAAYLGNDLFGFEMYNGRVMAYASDDSVSHTIKVIALLSSIVPIERKYIAEHIDGFAGEKVTGKVYTIDGKQVTAGKGAEVFNDYSTNIASGQYSHAEGMKNTASGMLSHAEGWSTVASGDYSHTEGQETTASESYAHAEGWSTEATNRAAHAEGFATHATGQFSHAEGDNATASGRASHAEGYGTNAVADYSHAEGMNTTASSEYQHVQGKYNIVDEADTYAHIVGNGTSNSSRKNAHTVDWKGNANFAGDVYVGNADTNKGGKKLATEEYADNAVNTHTDNKSNPHEVTAAQVGAYTKTETDTLLNKKANDYSLEIYNGTSGNPKPVRFMTVNYSTCGSEAGVAVKLGMVSGHGNGSSYAFLQDAIIRITYTGNVEVDNFKYYGAATGTYDGANRQYGDIFWTIDTTNKVVDFYCLMGQYARIQMTPYKRVTYSTGGTITQYTSCTVYSSGEKVWANNSDIALMSDIKAAIAAIPTPDVSGQINAHANDSNAHSDIRGSVTSLDARLSVLESSIVTTHSGPQVPSSALGEDGDLYLFEIDKSVMSEL